MFGAEGRAAAYLYRYRLNFVIKDCRFHLLRWISGSLSFFAICIYARSSSLRAATHR